MNNTTTRSSVYQIVTERIIAAIDRGVAPWRIPWSQSLGQPRNLSSGKAYRGVNVWLLAIAQWEKGYPTSQWVTYKQAQAMGGQVRKGEKSTMITFWKFFDTTDKKTNEPIRLPVLRYYNVFNVAQCDGLKYETPKAFPTNSIESAESIVAGMPKRPEIREGGRACYSTTDDAVEMPAMSRFEKGEDYYSTLFHELAHSTGHESRLNRSMKAAFGSSVYAREELVAEMTAAYLCAECGIIDQTIEQSAAYLASWKKRLQDDEKLFVMAASAAQKAADFIRGEYAEVEAETEQSEEVAV